ncbi:MAG: universal stress protein [Lewinellaceae bacterium]|nr:universal stress protein [Phaeodactylibacter sp.]MCB9346250.1 universal stress protein [Lewinellaceae bacterium]
MKNILFPTDLSPAAENAFIYALHLAAKLDATVTTLHVYVKPEVRGAGLPHTLSEFYASYDLEKFENYKDAIPALRDIQEAHGFSGVKVVHLMKPGSKVVSTIVQTAKEEAADMIIMGTTGARGFKEVFLGSIAGEVLENAECPVLAIPEKAEFDGLIDQLAFTTTYKEEEEKALEKVIDIMAPFHPEIHCINVDLAHTEPITHRMDQFKARFGERDNVHFYVLEGNDIKEAITGFLEENKIDVLAMVTHKRNFLAELFNYSRTKMMSYHSRTPVLSIPADIL